MTKWDADLNLIVNIGTQTVTTSDAEIVPTDGAYETFLYIKSALENQLKVAH